MDHGNTESHHFATSPNWYDRLMSISVILGIVLSLLWAALLAFGVARVAYYALT